MVPHTRHSLLLDYERLEIRQGSVLGDIEIHEVVVLLSEEDDTLGAQGHVTSWTPQVVKANPEGRHETGTVPAAVRPPVLHSLHHDGVVVVLAVDVVVFGVHVHTLCYGCLLVGVLLENEVLLFLDVLDSGVQVAYLAGTLEQDSEATSLQLVEVVAELRINFLLALPNRELDLADHEGVFQL